MDMPLYEYECSQCKHRFERIQKFSDPPVKSCPKCRGAVDRLLSSPAVQFKGSGWYATDYAKKSGGDGSKAESAAASDEKPGVKEKKTEKPKEGSPAKP